MAHLSEQLDHLSRSVAMATNQNKEFAQNSVDDYSTNISEKVYSK